jgi:hypothetical protein
MGKAKDRHCLECPEKPSIKGGSWSSHCRNSHNNRIDVAYKVNEAALDSLNIPICADSKHLQHAQLSWSTRTKTMNDSVVAEEH